MKDIPVVFDPEAACGIFLKNGTFSAARFKRKFRKLATDAITEWFRESRVVGPLTEFEIGRVTIRGFDEHRPKSFMICVSCESEGAVRWRQTFRYEFGQSGKSLSGRLVPGSRHYVKTK